VRLAADGPEGELSPGRSPARRFACAADEPRARRATDGVVLALGAGALALLNLAESPPPGVARTVARVAAGLPDILDGL
jgi:hypothetical protein